MVVTSWGSRWGLQGKLQPQADGVESTCHICRKRRTCCAFLLFGSRLSIWTPSVVLLASYSGSTRCSDVETKPASPITSIPFSLAFVVTNSIVLRIDCGWKEDGQVPLIGVPWEVILTGQAVLSSALEAAASGSYDTTATLNETRARWTNQFCSAIFRWNICRALNIWICYSNLLA